MASLFRLKIKFQIETGIQPDPFIPGEVVAMLHKGKIADDPVQLLDIVSKDAVFTGKSYKIPGIFMGCFEYSAAFSGGGGIRWPGRRSSTQ